MVLDASRQICKPQHQGLLRRKASCMPDWERKEWPDDNLSTNADRIGRVFRTDFLHFLPWAASKIMSDISDPIETSNNRQTGSPSHRQCPRTTGLAIIDGRLASASPQAVQLNRCRHGGVAPFKLHVCKLESKIQGFSHDTCMANWQIACSSFSYVVYCQSL